MTERITLEYLNSMARNTPEKMISSAESFYHSQISGLSAKLLSDKFKSTGKRVIFIAGPSGSGKTTTANLICDMLRRSGKPCAVVSLDMFYYEKDRFPKKADGSYDYENIESIDREKISECISDLLYGKEYLLKKYNFAAQSQSNEIIHLFAGKDGFVIAEGIHGLNPILLDGIGEDNVFRLFVSVSNGISCDGKTEAVSGKDLRFVRRLSRDLIYRGTHADKTVKMWQDVLDGENKYLYPYKPLADEKINTFHMFEVSVLKPFVSKALDSCSADFGALSGLLKRITEFFNRVTEIPENKVPENSLIREFIGGGIYEKLY